jgi:DNA-binding NarL/FixJ family response regulator
MTPFRVLLADDHALVRAGIRSLVEQVPGAQVVGETGDGHQTLKSVAESTPDVLLLDIGLPGLNGLEVADRLHRERPGIRVVMLSMYAGEEYVIGALRAGAAGYLLKDATVPELELALKAVMRGEIYLSPALSRQVIEGYMRRLDGETGPAALLTPRQREILQLIAEGTAPRRSRTGWRSASRPSRPTGRSSWSASGSTSRGSSGIRSGPA